MSFTVMRFKDGVPAPIKMSIWDAFKGAPVPKPPKPQPVSAVPPVIDVANPPTAGENLPEQPKNISSECPCCHKIHSTEKNSEKAQGKDSKNNTKGGSKDNENKNKNEAKDSKQVHSFSNHDTETYSEDDNKKIIEMKAKKHTWKEILAAINKESKSQLENHWKTIDPAKSANKDDAKSNTNTEKQGENKKAEGDKNKSKKNSKDEKTKNGELKGWSDRYDRQKWVAAASRHFDLTGQRITPAVAKQLAEAN